MALWTAAACQFPRLVALPFDLDDIVNDPPTVCSRAASRPAWKAMDENLHSCIMMGLYDFNQRGMSASRRQ